MGYVIPNNYGIWNIKPMELYTIGDIHGDFFALKQSLELTNCVKFEEYSHDLIYNKNIYELEDGCSIYSRKKISWNPEKKNCFIVFSGDTIDRCRSVNNSCLNTINDENCDYLILKLLFDLDLKAKEYNSRVIIVMGNHEIMNIKNMDAYVSNKGKKDNKRITNIIKLLQDNINSIYGIVRIDNYVIVHGGINDKYFNQFKKIFDNTDHEYIYLYNKYLQTYLKILLEYNDFDNVIQFHLTNEIENENYKMYKILYALFINNTRISPFWDRTLGGVSELNDEQCKHIFNNNILNIKTDINKLKIIVGHCPQFNNNKNINLVDCQEFEKRIFRIDVGMSRAFDNYARYHILDQLLDNTNINKCNNSDFNMFYDNYFQDSRSVSVLQIFPNNDTFNIIKGKTSIQYFNNYFKNCKDMLLYTLSDIHSIYSNLADPNNIKQKIQKIISSKDTFNIENIIQQFINFLRK